MRGLAGPPDAASPPAWVWQAKHTAALMRIRWTPDGQQVVSASADGDVRIWAPGRAERALRLAMPGGLYDFDLVPPQGLVFAGAAGRVGAALIGHDAVETRQGPGGPITGVAVHGDLGAYANQEGLLVLGRGFGDSRQQLGVAETGTRLDSLQFSQDGRWVTAGGADGVVWLGRLDESGALLEVQRLQGHGGPIVALAFVHGDGVPIGLISAAADGSWRRWPLAGRSLGLVLRDDRGRPLRGEGVISLEFLADRAGLVVRTKDMGDWRFGLDPSPGAHSRQGVPLVGSPPLAEGSQSLGLRALPWRDLVGERVLLRGHWATPSRWVESPDGQHVATAAQTGLVRLWPLLTPDGLAQAAKVLGRRCISAGDREELLLEDPETAATTARHCLDGPAAVEETAP